MSDIIIISIFFGIFILLIGFIVTPLIIAYFKGEIRIKLKKRMYYFGEAITGVFTLYTKKEIVGQELSVHIVGYKRESNYNRGGGKNTRRVEVARFSKSIEFSEIYTAGMKRDYDFSIDIPKKEEIEQSQQNDIEAIPNQGLGKLVRFAYTHMAKQRLSWQLQVDLEAEGIDIHGKKDIFIKIPQTSSRDAVKKK